MQKVSVQDLVDRMKLNVFTEGLDLSARMIRSSNVNRPGLELTGFFEHFATNRVQVIGMVEHSYLEQLPAETRTLRIKQLMDYEVPCIVICRGYEPTEEELKISKEQGVPILGTDAETSSFMSEAIYYLNGKLSPSISIHGVLVDIYGEGVLIMGESGIGKSEAALELIRRGHRLVSDDVVEIKKLNNNSLMGTAPAITRNFIELRGIGIVDVKALFGVECVKERQTIDMVIKLEEWKPDGDYDRLGLEDEYTEILGTKVLCHTIPIRPGRNLAVICETAAVNSRQQKMGYNAAQELYRRVRENLDNKNND